MKKYVPYYRVSTTRQGQSGLGLEAQREMVRRFCQDGIVIAEFEEVESGKRNRRPQLRRALVEAMLHGATLVIAKLDRLSRNVSFIFALRDSKVDFVACDMPEANTLTVGIFAVLAQHEREVTVERTLAALAAKRARGEEWVGPPQLANLTAAGRALGAAGAREAARLSIPNLNATDMIAYFRSQQKSFREIANLLNERGFRTRRGGPFRSSAVHVLWERREAELMQAARATVGASPGEIPDRFTPGGTAASLTGASPKARSPQPGRRSRGGGALKSA